MWGKVNVQSFCMPVKLSAYDGLQHVLCKLCGNYKAKAYTRYTKDNEKGIKEYHYRKSQSMRTTEEKRNKGSTHPEKNKKVTSPFFYKKIL